MTKIIDEHFPVSDLPERLRLALGNMTYVKLTIEDRAADDALRHEFFDEVGKATAQLDAGEGLSLEEVRAGLKARFGTHVAASE